MNFFHKFPKIELQEWNTPEPEPWKEKRAPIQIEDPVRRHTCNTEGCNIGQPRTALYEPELISRQCCIL